MIGRVRQGERENMKQIDKQMYLYIHIYTYIYMLIIRQMEVVRKKMNTTRMKKRHKISDKKRKTF